MSEQPVKGEEALRRMAKEALGSKSSQKGREEEVDPIEEARVTTRKMLADEIIATQLAKGKAEREEAEAKAAKAKADRAKAESGEGSGPGFKMTGEIGLGKFNMLELLEERVKERDDLRKEAEDASRTQAGINDNLREQLHAKELEVLKTGFDAQILMLGKLIESNASKGTFMDQYNMTKDLAAQIGYVASGAGTSDLTMTMELEKMKFEQNLELKKMAREEKRADREFQRQLKKDEDDREARKQDAERQSKREDMVANLPGAIGGALAEGLKSRKGGIGEEAPAPGKKKSRGKVLEVGVGEGGVVDCPECGGELAIGPTARKAVCSKCSMEYPIRRVTAEGATEPAAEEQEEESGLTPTY